MFYGFTSFQFPPRLGPKTFKIMCRPDSQYKLEATHPYQLSAVCDLDLNPAEVVWGNGQVYFIPNHYVKTQDKTQH